MVIALIQTLTHVKFVSNNIALHIHLIHDKHGGRCDINFDEHHSLIHIKRGIKYLIYSVITTHLISSLSKAGSKWHIH